MTSGEWQASAAYLYVLHLSAVELAWEYLRRNPDYRDDWAKFGPRADAAVARRWGLEFLWDPALDAREIQPVWLPSPSTQLRVSKSDEPSQTHAFSLWTLPGRKRLLLSSVGMLLLMKLDPHTALHITLNLDLYTGCPFLIGASPHVDPRRAAEAVARLLPQIQRPRASKASATRRRPIQKVWRHARHLQALDAQAEGATHREIAVALFGEADVWQRWTHDNSEIRAQTRYLLKCANALMKSGYRDLLTGIARPRQ